MACRACAAFSHNRYVERRPFAQTQPRARTRSGTPPAAAESRRAAAVGGAVLMAVAAASAALPVALAVGLVRFITSR